MFVLQESMHEDGTALVDEETPAHKDGLGLAFGVVLWEVHTEPFTARLGW